MKRLFGFIIGLFCMMSLTSCVSTAYAASDGVYGNDDVEISVVITNGTPYYYENQLAYWFYNGWYYYRYWYNDSWYYYRYRRPFVMNHGWRFVPHATHRPYYHHNPNVVHRHYNYNNRSFSTRPNTRSSTRITGPRGGSINHHSGSVHHGGRRFGGRR